MGRKDVYDALKVKDEHQKQMVEFIHQSNRRAYEAELRRQLRANGYVKSVSLTDPKADGRLRREARKVAKSIQRTYNRMLRNSINRMPDHINTDRKVWEALRTGRGLMLRPGQLPFQQAVRSYNTNSLNPWIKGRVQALAQDDFITQNGIKAKYRIAGPPAAQPDVCEEDISKGWVDDPGEFTADTYPAHPWCPHHVQTKVDKGSLPPSDSVWAGA